MRAGHNFWEIRRGVTAKPAFVGLGARRNISQCEARFSAPIPPPDNYCTALNSNSPFKMCRWKIEFITYNALTIAVQKMLNFLFFTFRYYSFVVNFVDENFKYFLLSFKKKDLNIFPFFVR